jgi:hypothetical protein
MKLSRQFLGARENLWMREKKVFIFLAISCAKAIE